MTQQPATPASSGLHSVDQSQTLADRVGFLATEGSKPEMQYAKRRTFELLRLKPGDRVLDVGCGSGDDVRTLAETVGPTGLAVGIDFSPGMVSEASARTTPDVSAAFHAANAYQLPYRDATFAGCRADRTFLHLAHPADAMSEMARVTQPGGYVVVQDRDIGTRTLDAADRAVTRKIVDFWCDSFLGGWIGRQLPRLFEEAGLVDVTIETLTVIDRDYDTFNAQYDFPRIVQRAQQAGAVTTDEAQRWLHDLESAGRAGRFFTSVTAFIVSGSKQS